MPEIQARREEKGWSRPYLARVAGVDHTTVWRVETGRHEPSQPVLRKLAKALGCSVADLLEAA